jgi:hypothetical protein
VAEGLKHLTHAQLRQLDAFLKRHHPHAKVGSLAEAYSRFPDFREFVLEMLDLGPVDVTPGLDAQGRGVHGALRGRHRHRHRPHGGRGGDSDRPPPITEIPTGLQIALAQAELTKTETDDLRVLRKEQALLQKALKDKRLTATQRLSLLGDLKTVDDQIASITDAHKKKKKKLAEVHGDKLIPQGLRLALAKAKTTEGEADDLKALNAEDRYLRKALRDKHLSKNRREALLNELAKIDRQIRALKKKDDTKGLSAAAQERQAFLSQQMGFFSEFAPDIFTPSKAGLRLGSKPTGGKTVIVNQNFLAPPASHFQNFHQARFAAEHAL